MSKKEYFMIQRSIIPNRMIYWYRENCKWYCLQEGKWIYHGIEPNDTGWLHGLVSIDEGDIFLDML